MKTGFYILDENGNVADKRNYKYFSDAQYHADKLKEMNEQNYLIFRVEQVWTTQKIGELIVD